MSKGSIVIVMTSHSRLGETGKETGFHYEEMTKPYELFREAGYEVTLASVKGGKPPHDPGSLKKKIDDNDLSVCNFLDDEESKQHLSNTLPVAELRADDYDALYLPGGHGTMWDFPENEELNRLVSRMFQQGKPVAAICHGVAGFIGAEDNEGQPLVDGRRINSFTDTEEKDIGLDEVVPFLLESKLRALGAKFECSGKFEAHVAEDKNLITGQNPASAKPLAEAVIAQLENKRQQAA